MFLWWFPLNLICCLNVCFINEYKYAILEFVMFIIVRTNYMHLSLHFNIRNKYNSLPDNALESKVIKSSIRLLLSTYHGFSTILLTTKTRLLSRTPNWVYAFKNKLLGIKGLDLQLRKDRLIIRHWTVEMDRWFSWSSNSYGIKEPTHCWDVLVLVLIINMMICCYWCCLLALTYPGHP
jgi:hypothetical protein